MKKFIQSAVILSLSSSLFACGGDGDLPLPPSVEAFVQANQTPAAGGNTLANQSTQNQKLDKIIDVLGDIKTILKTGKGVTVSASGSSAGSSSPVSSGGSTPSDASLPDDVSEAPAETPSETPSETEAPKVDVNLLGKIVDVLNNSPGLTVTLKKSERNLKTGKMTGRETRMTTNQSKVKVEVLNGETKGTKLVYNVGSPKVGVRPNGALSWVTTELAQNDDRLTTTNGYTLLQIDLASLSGRMGGPTYSAELIGKTTIGGETVHVVKITSSAPNALDSAITHEHIAFNPTNYNIKYWEAYTAASKEPYLRYLMTSFQVGAVPASAFKL